MISALVFIISFGLAGAMPDPSGPASDQECHVSDACASKCEITRDCGVPHDDRSCTRKLFPGITITDPACEAAKASQNQIYSLEKNKCDAAKQYDKLKCELEKQNCIQMKDKCTSILRGPNAALFNGASILWVDDHPENNKYEEAVLIELGARIARAPTTDAALASVSRASFDVIISDYKREDDPEGGQHLFDQLEKMPPRIPYILYSGSSNTDFVKAAKAKGMVGETNDPRELIDLVMEALEHRRHAAPP